MTNIVIDRNWFDCTAIDTESWIKSVTEIEIQLPERLMEEWVNQEQAEIAAFIQTLEGGEWLFTDGDNVYNHENDFTDMFTFTVFYPEADEGDWCYADNAYLAIEMHWGGDVRGNYGPVRLFKVNCPAESGLLDWMVGWSVYYADGLDADDEGRFQPGYSGAPTHYLREQLKADPMWSDKRGCFVGWLDGRAVDLHPTYYGGDEMGNVILPEKEVPAPADFDPIADAPSVFTSDATHPENGEKVQLGMSVKDFMRTRS